MKSKKFFSYLLLPIMLGLIVSCGGNNTPSSIVPTSSTPASSQKSIEPSKSDISSSSKESSIISVSSKDSSSKASSSSEKKDEFHGTLSLNPTQLELDVGNEGIIQATYNPVEGDPDPSTVEYKWEISDSSIASIVSSTNSVTVKAIKEGNTTLTCKFANLSKALNLKVSKKIIPVESISLKQTSLTLAVGEDPVLLEYEIIPSDATFKDVEWRVDKEGIVLVYEGWITAIGEGTANVIVSCGGKESSCEVTVPEVLKSYTAKFGNGEPLSMELVEKEPIEGLLNQYKVLLPSVNTGDLVKFAVDGVNIEKGIGPDDAANNNGAASYDEEGNCTISIISNYTRPDEGATYAAYLKEWSDGGYSYWIDGREAVTEKWVARYYYSDMQSWNDIELTYDSEINEYVLSMNIKANDKFCFWNSLEGEDAIWLHYQDLKYDVQLLASSDKDGNVLVNDPGKYTIYLNREDLKIGLNNTSYEVHVDDKTESLSLKLNRTSEDPKEGIVEYKLIGYDLVENQVLSFYKDGVLIPCSDIAIKDGANAIKEDDSIKVINALDAGEEEGIYLEKTSTGYALWVHGYQAPTPVEPNYSLKMGETDPVELAKNDNNEYYIINVDLIKDTILVFAKDDAEIMASEIEIKTNANAYKDGDSIKILNDYSKKDDEGIFLKVLENGYELWVAGKDLPVSLNYALCGKVNGGTEWKEYELVENPLGQQGEYMIVDIDMKANDEFLFKYNGKWVGFSNLDSGCRALFEDAQKDNNIIIKEDGKYDFYVKGETGEIIWGAKQQPAPTEPSYSVKINDANPVELTKNEEGEYFLYNIDLKKDDVLVFTKDDVALLLNEITLKTNANAYFDNDTIKVYNDFDKQEEKGILLKPYESGYELWIDGKAAPVLALSTDGGTNYTDWVSEKIITQGDYQYYQYKLEVINGSTYQVRIKNGEEYKKFPVQMFEELPFDCLEEVNNAGCFIKFKGEGTYTLNLKYRLDSQSVLLWVDGSDCVEGFYNVFEDDYFLPLVCNKLEKQIGDSYNAYYRDGDELYRVVKVETNKNVTNLTWEHAVKNDAIDNIHIRKVDENIQFLNSSIPYTFKLYETYLEVTYYFPSNLKAYKVDDTELNISREGYEYHIGETDKSFVFSENDGFYFAINSTKISDAKLEGNGLKFFTKDENGVFTCNTTGSYYVSYIYDINTIVIISDEEIKFGYKLNGGEITGLEVGDNEWKAFDLILTPNDVVEFYDCQGSIPVFIPVTIEEGSNSNFKVDAGKIISRFGGTFDMYLKLQFGNDHVYIEGDVTDPVITYKINGGEPITVSKSEEQWAITEIELGNNDYIELFADGEAFPFDVKQGCTISGLTINGNKATSNVDDSTFSFFIKETGMIWITRNYINVSININVDSFPEWKKDGAWVAAYVFNNEKNEWKFLNDGKLEVTTEFEQFIIVRMKPNTDIDYNPANDGLNWDNKWNQTQDQPFTKDDNEKTFNIIDWKSGEFVK